MNKGRVRYQPILLICASSAIWPPPEQPRIGQEAAGYNTRQHNYQSLAYSIPVVDLNFFREKGSWISTFLGASMSIRQLGMSGVLLGREQ